MKLLSSLVLTFLLACGQGSQTPTFVGSDAQTGRNLDVSIDVDDQPAPKPVVVPAAPAPSAGESYGVASNVGTLADQATYASAAQLSTCAERLQALKISITPRMEHFSLLACHEATLTPTTSGKTFAGGNDYAIPANAIPANALPASALPASAIPANALPASAIPANAIPSNFLWSGQAPVPNLKFQGSSAEQQIVGGILAILQGGTIHLRRVDENLLKADNLGFMHFTAHLDQLPAKPSTLFLSIFAAPQSEIVTMLVNGTSLFYLPVTGVERKLGPATSSKADPTEDSSIPSIPGNNQTDTTGDTATQDPTADQTPSPPKELSCADFDPQAAINAGLTAYFPFEVDAPGIDCVTSTAFRSKTTTLPTVAFSSTGPFKAPPLEEGITKQGFRIGDSQRFLANSSSVIARQGGVIAFWLYYQGGTGENNFGLANFPGFIYATINKGTNKIIYFGGNNTDPSLALQSATVLAADRWYHIALQWKVNDSRALYINGRKEGSSGPGFATPSLAEAPGDGSYLSGDGGFPHNHFADLSQMPDYGLTSGILDEVRIYQRVLTDQEICALAGTSDCVR